MNSFKKLSIGFSAFAGMYFSELAINIACGPEPDPYDYYVSYFHNNVPGDDYVSFSFTDLQFLYREDEPESEALINSREWAAYLGDGVTEADVRQLMYTTDRATDSVILTYLKDIQFRLPDSLSGNTYLAALAKNRSARDYYRFAKEVEPFATATYAYYWDPDPRDTMDKGRMDQLAQHALKRVKKSSRDTFLRARYAYQAARMYHYAGQYEQCVDTYDRYLATGTGSTAASGWALALLAGAKRRLAEPAEAAYLFSKVFSQRPERRVQAYKNFHYIDVPVEDVLACTQSDDERAAIWAIKGFNNADFDRETLRRVYALAPHNLLVGTLLIREINKLEKQLNEPSQYYNGGWWTAYQRQDSAIAKAREHASWLVNFSHQLTLDKRYAEPTLGVIAEAYVWWLLGNGAKAEALLASTDPAQLSERLADQYRIIELLVQVGKLTASNIVDEAAMLPALQWLEKKRQLEVEVAQATYGREHYYWKAAGRLYFSRTATNLYQSVLAPHYMRLGDTAMAALLMWHGNSPSDGTTEASGVLSDRLGWPALAFWQEQLQPAALERLAKWGREGLDRPWGPLFADRLSAFDSDGFWDLLGTAYLRVHDYRAAFKAFDNVSPDFALPPPINWYSTDEHAIWPDPFISTIKDYPKHFGTQALSKAEFAQAMADLQQRIVDDPAHAAEYYFQLANGVYQTGAFGNSWQLISYSWTSSDNFIKGAYSYSGDFHEAKQAAAWYAQARSLSEDAEFQAKCTFMLAKCEQKSFLFESFSAYYDHLWGDTGNKPDPFWVFSQQNRYFKELRDRYIATTFVAEAAAECSYLADFLGAEFP